MNRSYPGAPPVWGVPWRGVESRSLTCGDTVCRHTFPRFSRTWVTWGRILQTILRVLGGSGGGLFGYAAGLLSAIGCLEGQCEAG